MKINLLFKKWLISVFNPPYQFILDGKIKDPVTEKYLYIFKQYGTHDFIKISYVDICNNKSLTHAINPEDMKQIHITEYQHSIELNSYRVISYLRNNEYIVTCNATIERHSGDYIGKNLDKFSSIEPTDLWKIAQAESFAICRKLSSDMINNNGIKTVPKIKLSAKQKKQNNVVNFHDYKG